MGKVLNPNSIKSTISPEEFRLQTSIHKALSGNLDLGTVVANAPSSAGANANVATQFGKGNGSGILIRVAAHGNTSQGAPYTWGAVNTGIVLKHGLQRVPVGYIICDKDKAVDIYRTAPPDLNQITLAPTDNTASVTVYIF